ncbi:translation initiation factor IF-2-like [Dromiciops gliroides]|uniref:translation initiation factor IF-2-like n=1 Tax=Dromiciops gliroides TaxID=33562 RepID=UPI001CC4A2C6|nr:translation initiation factor IF-2-like [Dromiciops gliroides]
MQTDRARAAPYAGPHSPLGAREVPEGQVWDPAGLAPPLPRGPLLGVPSRRSAPARLPPPPRCRWAETGPREPVGGQGREGGSGAPKPLDGSSLPSAALARAAPARASCVRGGGDRRAGPSARRRWLPPPPRPRPSPPRPQPRGLSSPSPRGAATTNAERRRPAGPRRDSDVGGGAPGGRALTRRLGAWRAAARCGAQPRADPGLLRTARRAGERRGGGSGSGGSGGSGGGTEGASLSRPAPLGPARPAVHGEAPRGAPRSQEAAGPAPSGPRPQAGPGPGRARRRRRRRRAPLGLTEPRPPRARGFRRSRRQPLLRARRGPGPGLGAARAPPSRPPRQGARPAEGGPRPRRFRSPGRARGGRKPEAAPRPLPVSRR